MERNIAEIVLHYLVAALWTNEEQEEGLQGLSAVCNVDEGTRATATIQCQSFLDEASPLLTEDWTDEQIGHDIWMTRGGHGVGFWDRDLPNAKALSDICSKNNFHGHVFEHEGKMMIEGDEPKKLV